jgi:hypothetical protein
MPATPPVIVLWRRTWLTRASRNQDLIRTTDMDSSGSVAPADSVTTSPCTGLHRDSFTGARRLHIDHWLARVRPVVPFLGVWSRTYVVCVLGVGEQM